MKLPPQPGYTGLGELQAGLPAHYYFDGLHFQRELEAIWYRQWLYMCRSAEISGPGDYRVLSVGSQQVVVLRDEHGQLQAFHNTCRHRGSQLLQDDSGTLRSGALVCPYHAWRYNLQGELLRISSPQRPTDFDPACLSLYPVHIYQWRGSIFINLDGGEPAPLEQGFDLPGLLDNWPLESLQLGHTFRKTMACNWKVFWENYSECLHCPGVHPELARLVPVYGQFIMDVRDDPQWRSRQQQDPAFSNGLAPGMQTWSADGALVAQPFSGLTEAELNAGHSFLTCWPSSYIVAHADYVRIVRVRPLAANQTELQAQWLFSADTLANPEFDPAEVASFAQMVMEQDARVAEINQRGLCALPHAAGVLMPEEYEVHAFQQWVRTQLAAS